MNKIVGITGITMSHPVIGDQVFKSVKAFTFDETGLTQSDGIDTPILKTWSGSGTVVMSKKQMKRLKKWMDSFPKKRLPRKLKKHYRNEFTRNDDLSIKVNRVWVKLLLPAIYRNRLRESHNTK